MLASSPLLTLLLAAACGALFGLIGGVGGRRLAFRLEIAELWDAVDGLSTRLSKREGKAGRDVRSEREQAGLGDLGALAKIFAAVGGGARTNGLDPVEMERQRAEWSRRKDREDG